MFSVGTFLANFRMNVKTLTEMLQLLHPLKAQRLWRGERGLKAQPLSLCGDAKHELPCLQLLPTLNPAKVKALGA